jgi:hypothetical protein
MDSTSEQNGTGANTSVSEPEWPGGIGNDGMPLADPRIVEKLVEELKSQGMFDQIRKDCLAEVDTKPAYQNLRSRVSETVQRFLGRQRWNPSQNKNQLRNQLKQHIQQTPFMEDGVERIVEQVVNPKIKSVIEPEVENLICAFFGVELPNGTAKKKMECAKVEKEDSQKPKDYTVKDFLNGTGAGVRPIPDKVKKSSEFEELLKKSKEMMGGIKKEGDHSRKHKERDILRKSKEKDTLRKRKELDLIRKSKEPLTSKLYKEGLKRIKDMSPDQGADHQENNNSNSSKNQVSDYKDDDTANEEDDTPLYCI